MRLRSEPSLLTVSRSNKLRNNVVSAFSKPTHPKSGNLENATYHELGVIIMQPKHTSYTKNTNYLIYLVALTY
jgi:hypothetical protein